MCIRDSDRTKHHVDPTPASSGGVVTEVTAGTPILSSRMYYFTRLFGGEFLIVFDHKLLHAIADVVQEASRLIHLVAINIVKTLGATFRLGTVLCLFEV